MLYNTRSASVQHAGTALVSVIVVVMLLTGVTSGHGRVLGCNTGTVPAKHSKYSDSRAIAIDVVKLSDSGEIGLRRRAHIRISNQSRINQNRNSDFL